MDEKSESRIVCLFAGVVASSGVTRFAESLEKSSSPEQESKGERDEEGK